MILIVYLTPRNVGINHGIQCELNTIVLNFEKFVKEVQGQGQGHQ